MAPSLVETTASAIPLVESKISVKGLAREPLKLSGALDAFDKFDVTPVIGREFPNASLKEFLRAPNSDELLRDLAVTSRTSSKKFRRGLIAHISHSISKRCGILSQAG